LLPGRQGPRGRSDHSTRSKRILPARANQYRTVDRATRKRRATEAIERPQRTALTVARRHFSAQRPRGVFAHGSLRTNVSHHCTAARGWRELLSLRVATIADTWPFTGW
jgi:hypothetical protein